MVWVFIPLGVNLEKKLTRSPVIAMLPLTRATGAMIQSALACVAKKATKSFILFLFDRDQSELYNLCQGAQPGRNNNWFCFASSKTE